MNQACWATLLAYCLGCIPTGYYLVRYLRSQDLRKIGTGNLGARNVGRVLGWPGFAVTLVGDAAKGTLAVWAAMLLTGDRWVWMAAMLAVVAGHIWPIQLRFSGGKGVSTTLGALLMYDYRFLLAFGALFAIAWLVLRKFTLPGLAAFALLPWVPWFLEPDVKGAETRDLWGLLLLCAVVLYAHRKNLQEEFALLLHKPDLEPKSNHPEP